MGYSTGMLKHRVEILKRVQEDGEFGIRSGKPSFERVCCVWADVTWKKGQKALNAGAMDALDTVMFRMRWDGRVTRECFLKYDGVVYQAMQFHADRQDNTIQILATEVVVK